MSEIIELESEDNGLKSFLKKVSLQEKFENFQSNGLKQIDHLQDIHEKDIGALGLTVFEWRRLQREIAAWKEKESASTAGTQRIGAAFKTSSASTVIALPKSFRNFFGTRDGQGNVVVTIESLKRKYKNLWYENPVNPTQTFSNSFILQMAEQRMQFERTLRSCELWCRKQRSLRIFFLMAVAKRPAISTWNHYYKNQSVMGKCEIVNSQFPAVASFLELKESSCAPPKAMYEMICQYVGKLEEVNTFSTSALQKCDAEMAGYMAADGVPKRGYRDELAFLSEEARPKLKDIDIVIKERLQEARECMNIGREKHGYSTLYKSAKRKRQKGKSKETSTSTLTDSITVSDSEAVCEEED